MVDETSQGVPRAGHGILISLAPDNSHIIQLISQEGDSFLKLYYRVFWNKNWKAWTELT